MYIHGHFREIMNNDLPVPHNGEVGQPKRMKAHLDLKRKAVSLSVNIQPSQRGIHYRVFLQKNRRIWLRARAAQPPQSFQFQTITGTINFFSSENLQIFILLQRTIANQKIRK